jgi:hypothetical protein
MPSIVPTPSANTMAGSYDLRGPGRVQAATVGELRELYSKDRELRSSVISSGFSSWRETEERHIGQISASPDGTFRVAIELRSKETGQAIRQAKVVVDTWGRPMPATLRAKDITKFEMDFLSQSPPAILELQVQVYAKADTHALKVRQEAPGSPLTILYCGTTFDWVPVKLEPETMRKLATYVGLLKRSYNGDGQQQAARIETALLLTAASG